MSLRRPNKGLASVGGVEGIASQLQFKLHAKSDHERLEYRFRICCLLRSDGLRGARVGTPVRYPSILRVGLA